MVRFAAFAVSILLVGAVGLGVYVLTGNATSTVRAFATTWGAPVSDDRTLQVFTVSSGATAREIASELERKHLIRSELAFRMLVNEGGIERTLVAGDYELSPSMSTQEIVRVLSSGKVKRGVAITVVEGWRAEEIAARLEELGVAQGQEFLRLVADPYLAVPPQGLEIPPSGWEGYLFPATYEWDSRRGVQGLVQSMLIEFDARVGAELRQAMEARGLSIHEALTIASIVEREAARDDERAVIASVYLNRLRQGMLLQADPTAQYAWASLNPENASARGYWMPLALEDLTIDSPYNTYRVKGLPPGPICNPGIASIRAVSAPADTDFLYFVARGDGSHAFSRSAEEHAQNVRIYQGD